MREVVVTALELAGMACIVTAAALVHVALGLTVAGVCFLVIAFALEARR